MKESTEAVGKKHQTTIIVHSSTVDKMNGSDDTHTGVTVVTTTGSHDKIPVNVKHEAN